MPRGMPPCCRQPLVSEPSYPVPFHSSSSDQRSKLLDSFYDGHEVVENSAVPLNKPQARGSWFVIFVQ